MGMYHESVPNRDPSYGLKLVRQLSPLVTTLRGVFPPGSRSPYESPYMRKYRVVLVDEENGSPGT